jgi:hypothetical protein
MQHELVSSLPAMQRGPHWKLPGAQLETFSGMLQVCPFDPIVPGITQTSSMQHECSSQQMPLQHFAFLPHAMP